MSQPVPVPNIEFTLRQIATLSGLVETFHARLPQEGGVAGADSHAVLDAEANKAVSGVVVAACNRIEHILLDQTRWQLKGDSHETLVQIAQMERELMKSKVLSDNLGRTITKLQVFGPSILGVTEVPDVRAPQQASTPAAPAPAPVKKNNRRKK
jgi:hypothetical protein